MTEQDTIATQSSTSQISSKTPEYAPHGAPSQCLNVNITESIIDRGYAHGE